MHSEPEAPDVMWDARSGSTPHDPKRSTPKIAIMTTVYNESTNLPIWIGHYRRAAPSANLFVIDHGSDDGSTDNLQGVNSIPIPREKLDERDRVFLVNSFQQGFLRYYDIVIYTDCDELLVPNPARSATLEAHLTDSRYPYASPIGINVIHIVDAEPPIDLTQPILLQRRYGQFHSQMCKPLITRVPLKWEPGFHSCDQRLNIDRDLYLFHIKQIDKEQALRRQHMSRRISWSKDAIDSSHWAHHRYDDERFVREFFLDPANELRQLGAREFAFDSEIARLQAEAHEHSDIFHLSDFKGPVVEIPAIFRTAF